MKRPVRIAALMALVSISLLTSGCQRSVQYSGDEASGRPAKAVRGLGKRGQSRQVGSEEEFGWSYDTNAYAASHALDAQHAHGTNYLNPGEPKSGVPPYEAFKSPTQEQAQLFQTIYFGTNDDVVRGTENLSKIYAIASYLQTRPSILLFIEGHCDSRGSAAYNLALGSRRASSVRNLLLEQGVDASRLFTITFGKERPVKAGNSEDAWHWNRRTEYKLFQRS